VRRSATPATLRPMSWRRSEEVQDEDTAGYFLMLLTEAIAPAEDCIWHGQRRADCDVQSKSQGRCSVPARAYQYVLGAESGCRFHRTASPGTTGISGHRYCRRVNTASKAMVRRPADLGSSDAVDGSYRRATGPALIDDSVIKRGSRRTHATSPLGRWPGRQPCLALASTCGPPVVGHTLLPTIRWR
jgi:hypothetical protein